MQVCNSAIPGSLSPFAMAAAIPEYAADVVLFAGGAPGV